MTIVGLDLWMRRFAATAGAETTLPRDRGEGPAGDSRSMRNEAVRAAEAEGAEGLVGCAPGDSLLQDQVTNGGADVVAAETGGEVVDARDVGVTVLEETVLNFMAQWEHRLKTITRM